MAVSLRLPSFLTLVAAAACESASAPSDALPPSLFLGEGVQHVVNGEFTANVAAPPGVIIAQYALSGHVNKDGTAAGNFSFFADTPTGTIDFSAEITCLPVNEELGRAWVGGVITRNGSTRASQQGEIHQPGRDIWFRVANRGAGGSGDADRVTSLGFTGAGGVATSADYCALQPWANDGLALLSGNLTIR